MAYTIFSQACVPQPAPIIAGAMRHVEMCRTVTRLVVLLLLSSTVTASEWVDPSEVELYGSLSPKSIKGDFDGDGQLDMASIKVNRFVNQMALFVSLSSQPDTLLQLSEPAPIDTVSYIGLGLLLPGEHKTLCGKGYYECSNDEPATVLTNFSSIEYFFEEKASSFFLYIESSGTFQQFWSSD